MFTSWSLDRTRVSLSTIIEVIDDGIPVNVNDLLLSVTFYIAMSPDISSIFNTG